MPFLMILVAWGIISWLLADAIINERASLQIKREKEEAAISASSLGSRVGMTLAQMRNVPKVLTNMAEIETVLSDIGPDVQQSTLPIHQFRESLAKDSRLAKITKRLEATADGLGIDLVMVFNAAGDCLAASGISGGGAPIGVNHSDREYFRMARLKGVGQQYAVGRTTNTPGVYYSAAVTAGDRFVGAVVVKIDVSRLARMITDPNALITDENGVVIASGDSAYYMKAMPNARVGKLTASEKEYRYQQTEFSTLEIEYISDNGQRFARLKGRTRPMLEAFSEINPDFLTIRTFWDIPEVWQIKAERIWMFAIFLVAGCSVITSAVIGIRHFRCSKEYQAEIGKANAELVKLNDELLKQARFDVLTGCANRRYFLEELGLELKRAGRFNSPCSLAILDIDHFKAINDQFGHATGDLVLKHFSRSVNQSLRSSDLLGRHGGEEFALLMPQTTLPGALELAERIRGVVEASSSQTGEVRVGMRFTVSIGVAEWNGHEESAEALIARADEAMYTAKRSGRNRVFAGTTP